MFNPLWVPRPVKGDQTGLIGLTMESLSLAVILTIVINIAHAVDWFRKRFGR